MPTKVLRPISDDVLSPTRIRKRGNGQSSDSFEHVGFSPRKRRVHFELDDTDRLSDKESYPEDNFHPTDYEDEDGGDEDDDDYNDNDQSSSQADDNSFRDYVVFTRYSGKDTIHQHTTFWSPGTIESGFHFDLVENCDGDCDHSLGSLALPSMHLGECGRVQRPPSILDRRDSNVALNSNDDSDSDSNASTVSTLGLSRLGLSSSEDESESESSGLPVKHVSDTTEEDKQLFESPVDGEGNSQLHLSIRHKDEYRTVEIIRKATEFDDLNVPNCLGQTALHLAVTSRQGRIVRMLMCAGAYVSFDDAEGNTPLHLACSLGDTDIVKRLTRPIDYTETLDNKYQVPFTAIPQDLSSRNKDGKTCLDLAHLHGFHDICRLLHQFII